MKSTFLRAALALVLACASAPSLALRPAGAATASLSDGTIAESWRLPNGLAVTTRHVPRAKGVAVSICYAVGSDSDAPRREGLAELLAEVDFMAAAGDAPERSRAEMPSLRPLGWNIDVEPHHTVLCEIGTTAQFPGVLHQAAVRMAGVAPTESCLRAAVASVRQDLEARFGARPDVALQQRLRAFARGIGEEGIKRYVTGEGLRGATLKDVRERIRTLYVPANAVLSVAGDLEGIDLRRLIEREFGGIPGGTKPPGPALAPTPLIAGGGWSTLPGLPYGIAVLGIIAPALSDTTHPAFLMQALVLGTVCKSQWGPPVPPLTTRFEYSVLDDPELVRFYVAAGHDSSEAGTPGGEFRKVVALLQSGAVESKSFGYLKSGVGWLLGGPLPADLLKQVIDQPGTLFPITATMAARELRGGEAFWAEYRRRVEKTSPTDLKTWAPYFSAPQHHVQLILSPAR